MRTLAVSATLFIALAVAAAPGTGQDGAPPGAGLSPEARAKLWDMTALRRLPLEVRRRSSRTVPLIATKPPDPAGTGDPLVARTGRIGGGSVVVAEAAGDDRALLRVEEFEYNSGSTPNGPNRIYCAIARPFAPGGRVPVILVFHGGGGHASPALALAVARRHPGAAGLAMDYNGQFIPANGPVTRWAYGSRERQADLTIDLRDHPMYHHVIAARRAIDWLETEPWADPNRIGCFGVSAGGWLALILAGVDHRVRAVTTAVSAGGAEGTAARSARSLRRGTAEEQRLWLAAYEPMAYAADTTAAVFLQLATNDVFFWLSGAERNLAALGGKKRWMLRPNCNHNVGGPVLPETAPAAWMTSALNGTPSLPEIAPIQAGPEPGSFIWKVTGPRPIERSVLNWSAGTTVSPARYWIELPAERRGDVWSARVPAGFAGLSSQVFATAIDPECGAVSSTIVHRDGLDPRTLAQSFWGGTAIWDHARLSAAWRAPVGPLSSTQFEADANGRLTVGPPGENREFAVLTNSVVLSTGAASTHHGLRVRIDGRGQGGTLKLTLARDGGSLDEVAFHATIDYPAGASTHEIPWPAFQGADAKHGPVWPFDTLSLSGRRNDGSRLAVEAIEFLE